MEDNVLDIEGLHAQFEKWRGKSIHIEKSELRDKDHIQMALDSFSYDENERSIDGYEATYTLRLNGTGNITADHMEQALPGGVYDIPLEDEAKFRMHGNGLLLETDRGTYKITLEQ